MSLPIAGGIPATGAIARHGREHPHRRPRTPIARDRPRDWCFWRWFFLAAPSPDTSTRGAQRDPSHCRVAHGGAAHLVELWRGPRAISECWWRRSLSPSSSISPSASVRLIMAVVLFLRQMEK